MSPTLRIGLTADPGLPEQVARRLAKNLGEDLERVPALRENTIGTPWST